MKVLLCIRQDYYKKFSADTVQVLKLFKYLKSINVDVDINNGGIYDFSKYDIVHLFNLNNTGETYKYFKTACNFKKPVVITPNYWNMDRFYTLKGDTEEIIFWNGCKVYKNEILKKAKKIFVSSNIEKKNISRDFNSLYNFSVIHNGVEVESNEVPLYNFRDRYDLNNYVLSVGKVCESKNQLTLAKVCKDMKLNLVIVGNISDKKYFKECISYDNVRYFGFVDSYNLYNAYRFSKVHISAGFRDIPGISTLEAIASGCNAIATKEGCIEELLEDKILYCDPYEENTLYESIEKSMKLNKNEVLREYVLDKYKWSNFTKEVYEGYRSVLLE